MWDKVKVYGAHAIAYALGALTIVAGLKGLPPQYLWVPGVASIILTALNNVAVAKANGSAPSVTTVAKVLLPAACLGLIILSASAGLVACTTTPTQNQQTGIAVAVEVATGAAIQSGTSDPTVWKTRAIAYKAAALSIKAVNDGGTGATLASLQAVLQPLIAKLPPADQLAANALVTALATIIQAQLGSGTTTATVANLQTTVDLILTDVINTCTVYGA